MGNQPSGPQQAPPIPANLAPPLPPPCDLDCQKQKQLVLLKQAFDAADPEQDPAGYEKARVAYYTLLNGPGWLAEEKHRIASQEVEPTISSYQKQYESLKGEQKSQSVFANLANVMKAQEAADSETNSFLQKQVQKEKDEVAVLDRLSQVPAPVSYVGWIIDIVITLLGLFVAYKVYSRFISSMFTQPTTPYLTSP